MRIIRPDCLKHNPPPCDACDVLGGEDAAGIPCTCWLWDDAECTCPPPLTFAAATDKLTERQLREGIHVEADLTKLEDVQFLFSSLPAAEHERIVAEARESSKGHTLRVGKVDYDTKTVTFYTASEDDPPC